MKVQPKFKPWGLQTVRVTLRSNRVNRALPLSRKVSRMSGCYLDRKLASFSLNWGWRT